jgi:hypothetical protein
MQVPSAVAAVDSLCKFFLQILPGDEDYLFCGGFVTPFSYLITRGEII